MLIALHKKPVIGPSQECVQQLIKGGGHLFSQNQLSLFINLIVFVLFGASQIS